MMLKFTYCKNFAHAETREVEWDGFKHALTTFKTYQSKEQSIRRAAIIGGVREDESVGREANVTERTIAILDYDDLPSGVDIDDVEFIIENTLDCAYVAYSTFRHTPDAPRFRLAVPLSRPVDKAEYREVVEAIRDELQIGDVDDCSFVMNQLMFLPSVRDGVEPWSLANDGDAWSVPDRAEGYISRGDAEDEFDDLDIAVASTPLDITEDQMQATLLAYPANDLDYDDWLRVGMAIYHQTEGRGYDTWRQWSEQSPKHDEKHMPVKWRSFGGKAKPVTMASIIEASGGMRGERAAEAAVAVSQTLEQEAETVDSRESYNAFKKRVQALNEVQLPPDYRSALAAIVHEVYAKSAKMGLREVKSAFKHQRHRKGGDVEADAEADTVDAPDWLEGWVYAEADCLFVNTTVSDYAIKREAFRAKFDRMPEPQAFEMDAASFALNIVRIPTVVRSMYWPGQPEMFETEGKAYVNSYHDSGIRACSTLEGDDDGQAVVDLFLKHVENTIADKREGDILLDFMAYVYRNPSNRVRWGMLLWGIEGNGKTYFYHVMQMLLGRNATVINTSMVERPFNDWAVGSRLIGIEEIRISGTNKWRVLDQLKPMISNNTIAVEPKGATRYHAPNFASYLMTTNHMDAVPMSDNDRRYCVIFTRQRSQQDLFDQHGGADGAANYFDRLFSESERRIDAVGRYLKDRQLSADFNPHGRAPVTAGIEIMRDANVSEDRMLVEQAIEDHACGIVSDRIIDVTHLNNCVTMDGGDLPQAFPLSRILMDMGYTRIPQRRVKIKGTVHYIWYREADQVDAQHVIDSVRSWHEKDDEFSDVPF